MSELPIWKASFEFEGEKSPDGRTYAQSTSIIFRAADAKSAAESALRFYRGRERTIPGYFKELWCMKVYGFHVDEIDEDGRYNSTNSMFCYEAKIDSIGPGMTYERHIEMTFSR